MENRFASAVFDACLETVLVRITDARSEIVLQMMAASVNPAKIDRLQRGLEATPDGQARAHEFSFDTIPEQLASVLPQIVGLDLDRSSPMRILGIGGEVSTVLYGAKTLGHDVTISCRRDFLSKRLIWLYELPYISPRSAGDLPEGPFDLAIVSGTTDLASKRGWGELVRQVGGRLTDDGRIFVVLQHEPDQTRDYYPELVLSKLARMGARVSSKHGFVLLTRTAIAKFEAQDSEPDKDSEQASYDDTPLVPDGAGEGIAPNRPPPPAQAMEQRPTWLRRAFWRARTLALAAGAVVLGFVAAAWSRH